MVDFPKVSVITVVYNNVKAVANTIMNTLDQSYSNLEYIVVDGGSTDGTLDVIKEFDGRIRWISECDNGIYDAMMKGVKMSTGEWILFRNVGDFFYSKNSIKEVFKQYVDNGEDLIMCGIRHFKKYYFKDIFPSYPSVHYFDAMPAHHPATFIRKKTQLKYPFPPQYSQSGDYWFFISVLHNNGKYIKLDKVISLYDGITGATTDNYDISLRENASILKSFGAPPEKIDYLMKRSRRTHHVNQLRKKYVFYNWLYKLNYWYKVFRKDNWSRYSRFDLLFEER